MTDANEMDKLHVYVPVQELRDLIISARQCADDLEAELNARYPEKDRGKYPSEKRRYERDMTEVRDVRKYAGMIAPKVML